MKIDTFIKVAEVPVKRNGPEKVLTVGHLLNMLKLVRHIKINESEELEEFEARLVAEMSDPNY